MAFKKKKGVNKKALFAIVLLAIIAVGIGVAALLTTQKHASTLVKVGVKVGDTFTYSLSSLSSGSVPDTISPDFTIYNNTDYYKVTVTAINGTQVSLDTKWALKNGTVTDSPQKIDLASGILTDQNGFYPIYPADMKSNETVYPHVYQNVWINGTNPVTYGGVSRIQNYYTATNTLYYSQDPTHSTECYTYDQVQFDRQMGMATSLISIRDYNNPEISTEIIWSLTSTNAWSM